MPTKYLQQTVDCEREQRACSNFSRQPAPPPLHPFPSPRPPVRTHCLHSSPHQPPPISTTVSSAHCPHRTLTGPTDNLLKKTYEPLEPHSGQFEQARVGAVWRRMRAQSPSNNGCSELKLACAHSIYPKFAHIPEVRWALASFPDSYITAKHERLQLCPDLSTHYVQMNLNSWIKAQSIVLLTPDVDRAVVRLISTMTSWWTWT